ncbi:hypothetical protein RPYSC3_48070 [Rhodopseudomonas palustris]|nr:hypothetical protein RPYSC3_48070 [Rhodopseudomonas palustris]
METLRELQDEGIIRSFIGIDRGKDPLQAPPQGYPFAIVGMPKVGNKEEDSANNTRKYHWEILFVFSYENMPDPTLTIEGAMDAIINKFDTNFTLSGEANAGVDPATIESFPVSTGSQELACLMLTLEASTTYQLGS